MRFNIQFPLAFVPLFMDVLYLLLSFMCVFQSFFLSVVFVEIRNSLAFQNSITALIVIIHINALS